MPSGGTKSFLAGAKERIQNLNTEAQLFLNPWSSSSHECTKLEIEGNKY
jgi:hypothetical protein